MAKKKPLNLPTGNVARSPYATDEGYVRSRRCLAPCGGWIVLYDLGAEHALRWRVMHQPSGAKRECTGRPTAEKLYKALVEGSDKHGVLPKLPTPEPVSSVPVEVLKPVPQNPTDTGNTAKPVLPCPVSAVSEGVAQARARGDGAPASPVDGKRLEMLNYHFLQMLEERFPVERLMDILDDGVRSMKSYQVNVAPPPAEDLAAMNEEERKAACGIIETPDHPSRVKYLGFIIEHKFGKPYQRPEVKPKAAVGLDSFIKNLKENAAYRTQFRLLLDEAEREAGGKQEGKQPAKEQG